MLSLIAMGLSYNLEYSTLGGVILDKHVQMIICI